MTCSLQDYRLRIGTYQQSIRYRTSSWKKNMTRTNYLKTSFPQTLLINLYLMILCYLPVMLDYQPLKSNFNQGRAASSTCTVTATPTSTFPLCQGLICTKPTSLFHAWYSIKWDLGPCRPTIYLSRKEINRTAHATNGNRGKRGQGITCLYWNKGPSLLTNKHQDLETLVAEHHPHILGLGEANFSHAQDLDSVQFPGYNLHLDTGIETQGMARVAIYSHCSLRVRRRYDLEDADTAAIWLDCGLPGQKSFLICAGYRQWRLLGQEDNSSATVQEQLVRWTKFLDKWEAALKEDKEVIVMLDANLDFLTWRNCDHLPSHHSSNKLKSLIDTLFARIIPLGVSQQVTVPTRMESGQPRAGLDHLYTNRPDKLSQVYTYYTGMSDHKLLKVVRFTKSWTQSQRYVRKRSFKNFKKEEFKQKLGQINLHEVMSCTDVNTATELLTHKLTEVLDLLAPIKTFQTRTQYAPWLSEEAKLLKKKREEAFKKASESDDVEDWRYFRSVRNQVTARSRADKKKWEEVKLEKSDDMWSTVKTWLRWNGPGPPTQLFHEGRIVTRPAGIASSMNKFFIEKVKTLRQTIPLVDRDPLKQMKEAMQEN